MIIEKNKTLFQLENKKKNKTTLHKIWVYKSVKPAKGGICTMCGMVKITYLDLTKKDSLTYEVNDSLFTVPYKVEDNFLDFIKLENSKDKAKFKISKLTRENLGLTLVVEGNSGETKIKGELLELLFEESKK